MTTEKEKKHLEDNDNCSNVKDLGLTSTSLLSASSAMRGLINELRLCTDTWYHLKESPRGRPAGTLCAVRVPYFSTEKLGGKGSTGGLDMMSGEKYECFVC